jgi:putative chitinase
MKITSHQLKAIAPHASMDSVLLYSAVLSEAVDKWEINTPQRLQAFLAQLAHESGYFRYIREIASGNAYEGRKDLGNIYPGDGKKFKGRGLIQITGRNNYLACSMALFGDNRLLKNPDILATPQYAVESACWFWKKTGLNEIADKPDTWTKKVGEKTYTKFQWITRKINGGLNGISDREELYERAKKFLT